jgi:glutamate transport system permease protein
VTFETVLFDQPGPRALRRTAIATAVSVVVICTAAGLALWQLYRHHQLDEDKWYALFERANLRFLLMGSPGEFGGLAATLAVTVVAVCLATPLGLLVGLARLARTPAVRWSARAYTEIFRALPLLLVLFAFFIGLPRLGIVLPRFWQLTIAIVIVNVATLAEVFRAGVLSLPTGQSEAAYCVGMRYWQVVCFVVVPQALRRLRPALISQVVQVLKQSTFGSVVSYLELLYAGELLAESDQVPPHSLLPTYLVVAAFYVAVNAGLSGLATLLDRRMSRQRKAPHVSFSQRGLQLSDPSARSARGQPRPLH